MTTENTAATTTVAPRRARTPKVARPAKPVSSTRISWLLFKEGVGADLIKQFARGEIVGLKKLRDACPTEDMKKAVTKMMSLNASRQNPVKVETILARARMQCFSWFGKHYAGEKFTLKSDKADKPVKTKKVKAEAVAE